jgi:hypothetical protein
MTRWKASAFHFAISFAVLASIFALVLQRWYPPALFGMAKAGPLLSVLAGVDLVLGPLLTLIVFRPGKKGLKFDLVVIAILQVAALAFGLHTLWQSRPVYIVATTDRFHLIFANEIDPVSAGKASPEYRDAPWLGPRQVSAPLPEDPKARMKAMIEAMTGLEIHLQPSKYRAYPGPNRDPMAAAIPVRDAMLLAPADSRAILQRMSRRHGNADTLALLPLKSSRGSAGVLVDRGNGAIVEFVGIDPWPIFDAALKKRRLTNTAH